MYIDSKTARAIQVARAGNFKLGILFPDEVSTAQMADVVREIGEHCKVSHPSGADLLIEYAPPAPEDLFRETQVVNQGVIPEHLYPGPQLDEACKSLLKIAYERLRFEERDTDICVRIAQVLSVIGGKRAILVEHMAEAIHYRAVMKNIIEHQDGRYWQACPSLAVRYSEAVKHIVDEAYQYLKGLGRDVSFEDGPWINDQYTAIRFDGKDCTFMGKNCNFGDEAWFSLEEIANEDLCILVDTIKDIIAEK